MISKAMFSSKSNEWATPIALFQELDKEFHFTLDPCATPENAKCERFYTIDNDGLTKNWGGIEYSVILHTVERSGNGCRNVWRNQRSQGRLSSFSYRQERILPISTITSITRRRKSGSFVAGCTSTKAVLHRSRLWL